MTKRLAVTLRFATALLAQTTRSVWDGVYTADQSKRGQQLYAKSAPPATAAT